MKVGVYVRPGSPKTAVGGTYDGLLLLRVREKATEGRATAAAIGVLADALCVPRRNITLVRGEKSRWKLFEIAVDPETVETVQGRLADLRR